MEKKIEELTDELRKIKNLYDEKMAEATQLKELFYRVQGKLELANELSIDKKEKKWFQLC